MPVSITTQPAANSLNAAYRPIIVSVNGTGNPVVYCDIYFNGTYYKSVSKTQAPFDFDIQNAAKEFLKKYLPPVGGAAILNATQLITSCYVKIRGSQIDLNGFTAAELPVPIQATGTTGATSGGGVQSNTFYILNASLQQEDNQSITQHMSAYKKGSWAGTTFPLTHRVDGYQVSKKSSDYFPVVSDSVPSNITLNYHRKSTGLWYSTSGGGNNPPPPPPPPTCVAVSLSTVFNAPAGKVDEPYTYAVTLQGTTPYTLSNIVKPTWMNISITGATLNISGTPTTEGTITISFKVNNPCGTVNVLDTVAIAPVDVPVNGPHFGNTTFNSSDTLNTSETATLVGDPNSTITVTLTTLDNTNTGQLLVNGSQAIEGNTYDINLDGNGNGSFDVAIQGQAGHQGSVIRGIFEITSVTSGTVGTPSTYQISKIY